MEAVCALLDRAIADYPNLHQTLIRNENAYYACIAGIRQCQPPVVDEAAPLVGKVYVIGDSHTLPTAWRVVRRTRANGDVEDLVLVPRLVTGVKIWHLRPDSKFYTKVRPASGRFLICRALISGVAVENKDFELGVKR